MPIGPSPEAASSSAAAPSRNASTRSSGRKRRWRTPCSARKARSCSRNSGRPLARIETASNPALVAPALPMASVATGTPAGIWTIESSESSPFSAAPCTGTPSTGSVVWAATMPGRCAAPPAPAMMTSSPRVSAVMANSAIHTGVRCAETMCRSHGTPKRSRASTAWRMVSQSDEEPMMTATSGAGEDGCVMEGRIVPV